MCYVGMEWMEFIERSKNDILREGGEEMRPKRGEKIPPTTEEIEGVLDPDGR